MIVRLWRKTGQRGCHSNSLRSGVDCGIEYLRRRGAPVIRRITPFKIGCRKREKMRRGKTVQRGSSSSDCGCRLGDCGWRCEKCAEIALIPNRNTSQVRCDGTKVINGAWV